MRRWGLVVVLLVGVATGVHAQPAVPEAAGEGRVHARRQVSLFEGVIETAVSQGAEELISRARAILSTDLLLLSGTPEARGFRLPGYGVFVDVAVPPLRPSLVWSLRTVASDQAVVRAAFDQLRAHVASIQDATARPRLEEALRRLAPRASPGDPGPSAGSGPGVRRGSGTVADTAWLDDPDEAYTAGVRRAIGEAILDHSGSLALGPTERLTVAARDLERVDRAAPGHSPSILTLSVRGGDLEAFRDGAISREEALARIEVEQQ